MVKRRNSADEKQKFIIAGILAGIMCLPIGLFLTMMIFGMGFFDLMKLYPNESGIVCLGIYAVFFYNVWKCDYNKRFPDTVKKKKPTHRAPPENFPEL